MGESWELWEEVVNQRIAFTIYIVTVSETFYFCSIYMQFKSKTFRSNLTSSLATLFYLFYFEDHVIFRLYLDLTTFEFSTLSLQTKYCFKFKNFPPKIKFSITEKKFDVLVVCQHNSLTWMHSTRISLSAFPLKIGPSKYLVKSKTRWER